MASGRISRRSVLAGAVVAGVAAVAAGCAKEASLSSTGSGYERSVDVVVVGAGLAGLSAATQLTGQGRSVVVLEARDRVGGRMIRQQVIEGGWIDLGGQWIGPTMTSILELAKSLNIGHFDFYTTGQSVLYYAGHRSTFTGPGPVKPVPGVSAADLKAAGRVTEQIAKLSKTVNVDKPWLTPGAGALDSQSVARWAQDATPSVFAQWLVGFYTLVQQGVSPSEMSMLYQLFGNASGPQSEEPEKWLFDGGAGQIPPLLAAQLGDRIVLSQPVYQIDQDATGVTVTTPGGRYRANFVIVAVPPSLAGAIIYNPAMPAQRLQLTQRFPMGSVIKFAAIYPTAWWRKNGLSGQAVAQLPTLSTGDSSPPSGTPGILTSFFIGDPAVTYSAVTPDARKQVVLENLSTYFGGEAMSPAQFVEMDWLTEPWTGGAYNSFMGPGVLTAYGPAISEPVGRIHWAGTEVARRWNGFFEGAVNTGHAAAQAVLALS